MNEMKKYLLLLSLVSNCAHSEPWAVVKDYDFSGTTLNQSFVAFTAQKEIVNNTGEISWLRASFVCNKYTGDYLKFKIIHSKKGKGVLYWRAKDNEKWKVSDASYHSLTSNIVVNSKVNAGFDELLRAMKDSKKLKVSLNRVDFESVDLDGFDKAYKKVKTLSQCK